MARSPGGVRQPRRDRLRIVEQMENRLSDGRTWLCGDKFTLADIALGPRVEMFPVVGVPDLYTRFPRIGKFMERLSARPSWVVSGARPEPGETERAVQGTRSIN